ncbi:MAG: exonuclease [Pseudomonadota bacterium]
MANWHNHFVLDVEADGPCPAMFNLISFGLVNVDDPTKTFLGKVAPIIPDPGIEAARAVSDISFEEQDTFQSSEDVFPKAVKWLTNIAGSKRPTIWSDNPAFDWQFWNYYCHRFLGENPAGFSARRIGDMDAGRRGKPLNTSAWKKYRKTAHTHNPVDDALGNVEALRWILAEMGEAF